MFGLDSDIGGSALRLWIAAGSAALLVFVCALAIDWTRTRTVARVGVVVVGALLGATLSWAFLNGASHFLTKGNLKLDQVISLAASSLKAKGNGRRSDNLIH